jgi:hypothetical protein
MGYKPSRTLYRLRFEDRPGLEVVAKSTSVEKLMGLMGLVEKVGVLDEDTVGADDFGLVEQVLRGFAEILHSWNVEDEDDRPIPATYEGLITQELPFVMEVVSAAVEAISAAPPPLPKPSSAGAALEASIPMTPMQENPES